MTFIVSLIALVIERFFDWSHLRHWYWFTNYQKYIAHRFADKSSYLILALSIVPLLIIVLLLEFLLQNALYGFVQLLFQLFILLYCLGPQNLWADTFSCISALRQGDKRFVEEKVKKSSRSNYSQSLHRHFLNNIFIEGNRRVFAVVFWFVVLGPIGAVLYRAVSLSAATSEQETNVELYQTARSLEAVLDWLPVRVFAFIFALGGHFVRVLSCWQKKILFGLHGNETILTDCGIAAMGLEDEHKILEDGTVEKHAISLLDRAFVITLVVIALIVLLT